MKTVASDQRSVAAIGNPIIFLTHDFLTNDGY